MDAQSAPKKARPGLQGRLRARMRGPADGQTKTKRSGNSCLLMVLVLLVDSAGTTAVIASTPPRRPASSICQSTYPASKIQSCSSPPVRPPMSAPLLFHRILQASRISTRTHDGFVPPTADAAAAASGATGFCVAGSWPAARAASCLLTPHRRRDRSPEPSSSASDDEDYAETDAQTVASNYLAIFLSSSIVGVLMML